jgi:hypothetical protein
VTGRALLQRSRTGARCAARSPDASPRPPSPEATARLCWTREQIRAARLAPLPPLAEKRGFALLEHGGANFDVREHPGLIVKDSYWRWPERAMQGNAIDPADSGTPSSCASPSTRPCASCSGRSTTAVRRYRAEIHQPNPATCPAEASREGGPFWKTRAYDQTSATTPARQLRLYREPRQGRWSGSKSRPHPGHL